MFLKEIRYRRFNFLMGLLGIITLVALVVAFYTMMQATSEETRKLTRDMGFNVRIIPATTDMNDFWAKGYATVTMPEKVVDKMIDRKSVNYAHLTATLHKRIVWREKDVILSGISSHEREPSGKKKSKMIFSIPPEKVYVGYELARSFSIEKGDTVNILRRDFTVVKTMSESGSDDDVRFFFNLKTLQKMLQMPGRINEVMAINCMCSTKTGDPVGVLRAELQDIAPNAKVIMKSNVANAREKQRKMADRYFRFLFPLLLLICAIWLGSVTMNNINDRTVEIGMLRAMGFSKMGVLSLFLKRIIAIGLLGSVIGFFVGTFIAYQLGVAIFFVAKGFITPHYELLFWAMLLGTFFAMFSALPPIAWAVSKDASNLLKEN